LNYNNRNEENISQFKLNLEEITVDFGTFESEFSANNWADIQTAEVGS